LTCKQVPATGAVERKITVKAQTLAWFAIAILSGPVAADPPKPIISGLKNPRAVAVGADRRVYVTVCDDPEKAGAGAVLAIEGGKAVPFATGLDAPTYMAAWQNWLFVADKECVWRIDRAGKAARFVALHDIPGSARSISGACVDEKGTLYLATAHGGEAAGQGSWTGVARVDPRGKVQPVVNDPKQLAGLRISGIAMDGMSHLLLHGDGAIDRMKLVDGSIEHLTENPKPMHGSAMIGGLAWDYYGRLYATGVKGDLWVINRPGEPAVECASGFEVLGCPCLSPDGKAILVPDVKTGAVTAVPAQMPGKPIDETPLPLAAEIAFPDLEWAGWSGETPEGKPNPLRPLVLTHAHDNSGRNFVATEHGVIHVFPNDQATKKTKVFLDIQSKVRYDDKSNEEGLLGLAFHPDYKRTGEFFVFYTEKTPGHNNVLSRFRVRRDDPDQADPASEEVLLRVQHKHWNHDGGTVIFGPDGFLYLALGDGGFANDPDGNGQNLNTLLGKIIRIDINRRDGDTPYGVPKDNPFVGRTGARPEIYAYGLRNVWRMAFDRATGRLWAADVGQNLYEEIDLIEKGGNFGWGIREALHPFGPKGVGPRPDLIDPIWEYHHDVGKSITGGAVYRGSRFPELTGMYLYADYVSGKISALRYDEKAKRVVANRPIVDPNKPIMSFGEDERGELYVMTYALNGRGIYRFIRSPAASAK
jgi:glucose/arabinose dehydrogenase